MNERESRLRFFGIYRDSDFLQICVIASPGDARQARRAAAANGLATGKGYHAREMNSEIYCAGLERAGFSVTHSGGIK